MAIKDFDTLIGTDKDFKNNEPRVWLLAEFKTKPKLNRTYIDFGYNFGRDNNDIQIFATYTKYSSKFSMTDGVTKIWLWSLRNQPFPLQSWYQAKWNAIGLGLHYNQPIRKWLLIGGKIRYFPKFTIKGNGYWDIRNLTFEHRGTDSEMFSVNFDLSFKPVNFCVFKVGYNLEKMK